jgi:hypothetical protein
MLTAIGVAYQVSVAMLYHGETNKETEMQTSLMQKKSR